MKTQNKINKTQKNTIIGSSKIQQRKNYNYQKYSPFNSLLTGIVLLAIIVMISYFPALFGEFVWDDVKGIEKNPLLRTADGLWKIWLHPTMLPYEVHYWPIVYTFFWLEYHLWNLNPFWYHLVNITIHLINTILLWGILRRLAVPGALLAAAIFGVHPVHTESVAWIIELKDVLSGMFYLTVFLLYLQFEDSRNRSRNRNKWYIYAASLFFFLCAMLSKSIAVSLPIALLLALWWKKDNFKKDDIVRIVPFFVIAFFLAAADMWFVWQHQNASYGLSLIDKCLIAGRAFWFYIGKVVFPVGLIAVYPRWEVNAYIVWQYIFPLSAAALLLLLWFKKNRFGKGVLIAVLYFTVTLSPVLGFVEFGYMTHSFAADRFQYLASIGIIILFSGILAIIGNNIRNNKWVKVGVVCLLVFTLGFQTWEHSKDYKDDETLFTPTVAKNPNDWIARVNLGAVLYQKNKIQEAITHLEKALELNPAQSTAHLNLGSALFLSGRINEARTQYLEALRLEPNNAEIYNNLGLLEKKDENFKEAVGYYEKALQINPDYGEVHRNLALALLSIDKYDEAITHCNEALHLDPNDATTYLYWGIILMKEKKYGEAISKYRQALGIDPKELTAANALAWALAASGDEKFRNVDEAVQLATMVCERTRYAVPEFLDTLAVAYAAAGRFDDAVQIEEKAVQLARSKKQEDAAKTIESRLILFKQKKAFYEN